MNTVFLDTAALVALCVRDDGLHNAAMQVRDRLNLERAFYVVTEYVLAEFLSALSHPRLRQTAIGSVDRLKASPRTTVIPGTSELWESAYQMYRDRLDKAWSLVDCASIVVCRDRGITRVFTQDRHFTQAGFEVLL